MIFIAKTTYFDATNIETALFLLILINKSNIIWILKIISLTLHSLIRTAVPYIGEGLLAEWLGTGLQNRLRRFESARDLQGKKRVDFSTLYLPITDLAQLVEHWSPTPGVGSSSLSIRASFGLQKLPSQQFNDCWLFCFYTPR